VTKHMTGHVKSGSLRGESCEAWRFERRVHMRIGIIGAGGMGGILARRLAKLGHHVAIANSRGPESLTALAAEIGATPVSVVDAAKAGEIVILAIPTKAVADLPRALFANVPSSVVIIDIGNYHPAVIKAFNNIFATSLLENGVPRGNEGADRSLGRRRFVGRQGRSASPRRRSWLRPCRRW
jgi:6-phosphogluconate dehydrogenase (decarboxylating)